MAGIKIKNKLKAGEKITGQVIEVFEKAVILENEQEARTKLSVPEEVAEVINDSFDDHIITISVDNDGEYEIDDHEDEWPKKEGK